MSVFLPFDRQILTAPVAESSWLALGLTQIPESSWKQSLTIVQPWRANYLALRQAGFCCFPELSAKTAEFDGGLLQLGKHKGQNQNRFVDLMRRVKVGGMIVVSGDKSAGVLSFLKWVNTIDVYQNKINSGTNVTSDGVTANVVTGKLAKNHGVIFWLDKRHDLSENVVSHLVIKPQLFDGDFTTEAGMFSHGRVDGGSKMLIKYMDRIIFGKTADFGAGWGYLSCQALKMTKKLTALDLYEADYNALEAARRHVTSCGSSLAINYYWRDITGEPIEDIYDTILANPPFHEGRAADVALGQKFIEIAAQRLKPGGCLLMVANRQLPYEATLNKVFRKVFVLEEQNGFKVFEARK
nr:class I SAM-dependent methyltransferase [uncultured Bartonella sp.]